MEMVKEWMFDIYDGIQVRDIPGAWQEHGLFDEDRSRKQNVPTRANVIRTAWDRNRDKDEEKRHSDSNRKQNMLTSNMWPGLLYG